jgi:hypothetical protein
MSCRSHRPRATCPADLAAPVHHRRVGLGNTHRQNRRRRNASRSGRARIRGGNRMARRPAPASHHSPSHARPERLSTPHLPDRLCYRHRRTGRRARVRADRMGRAVRPPLADRQGRDHERNDLGRPAVRQGELWPYRTARNGPGLNAGHPNPSGLGSTRRCLVKAEISRSPSSDACGTQAHPPAALNWRDRGPVFPVRSGRWLRGRMGDAFD